MSEEISVKHPSLKLLQQHTDLQTLNECYERVAVVTKKLSELAKEDSMKRYAPLLLYVVGSLEGCFQNLREIKELMEK